MKRLLPVLVALLVGVAVGWLIPREAPSTPPPAIADHRDASPGDVDAKLPSTPHPDPVETNRQPDPAAATETDSTSTGDAPELPTGTGEATGVAVYADGRPASGVELIATARNWGIPIGGARDDKSGTRTTTADDGSFRFAELQEDWYTIYSATPDKHLLLLGRARNHAVMMRPGGVVRLLVVPMAKVTVSVLGIDGTPVPEAQVTARGEILDPSHGMRWTPADTTLYVIPGHCTATASIVGQPHLKAEATLDAVIGKENALTLQFSQPAGLYLKVITPPLFYASTGSFLVTAEEAKVFDPTDATRRTANGANSVFLSETERVYTDLPAGDYVLVAMSAHGTEYQRVPLQFGGGTEHQEVTLDPLDPADHFLLRVIGPGGHPRLDADISAQCLDVGGKGRSYIRGEDGTKWQRIEAMIPDESGTWWLHIPEVAGDSPTMRVVASVRGLGRVEQDLPMARGVVRELRLIETSTIVVNVVGLDNESRNRMEIQLLPQGAKQPMRYGGTGYMGQDRQFRQDPMIADRVEFRDVPVGQAEVIVKVNLTAGRMYRGEEIVRRTVEISNQAAEVTIRLPAVHTLRVRVPSDNKIEQLVLTGANNSYESNPVAGVFEWTLVPPGEYVVTEFRQGQMKIRVAGDTEVEWRPSAHNAIVLMRLDEGGLLEAAGFKEDDAIKRVNGVEMEGYDTLRATLTEARKPGPVRMEVLRGSESVIVEIDGAKLDEALKNRASYNYQHR
jgi:hypothetical protein